jgi:hypothetical protein
MKDPGLSPNVTLHALTTNTEGKILVCNFFAAKMPLKTTVVVNAAATWAACQ